MKQKTNWLPISIPGYGYVGVWWDSRVMNIVPFNPSWKKDEKQKYITLIGALERSQNRYRVDEKGIYRVLYGEKAYFWMKDARYKSGIRRVGGRVIRAAKIGRRIT